MKERKREGQKEKWRRTKRKRASEEEEIRKELKRKRGRLKKTQN